MKISKFQIAIIFGVLIIGIIAFVDIQGVNLIGYDRYTSGDFNSSVWEHFLLLSLILMAIPPLLYWFFYRKDKSEVLAIYLVPLGLFWFGANDILYFWFQNKAVPNLLPHLNNHPIIGFIGNNIFHMGVTNYVLFISIFIGGIITYFVVKFLKEKL